MSFSFLSFIDQRAKRHGGLSEMGETTQQVESVVHHYLETVRPIDVVSPILSPLLILNYACAFPLQAYLGLFKAWGCCRCW